MFLLCKEHPFIFHLNNLNNIKQNKLPDEVSSPFFYVIFIPTRIQALLIIHFDVGVGSAPFFMFFFLFL